MDNLSVTDNTLVITDAEGSPVKAGQMQPGQTYTVKAVYNNRSSAAQTVQAIGALTSEKALLTSAASEQKTVQQDGGCEFTFYLTVPENCNPAEAKCNVFFWSGTGEIEPLSAPLAAQ